MNCSSLRHTNCGDLSSRKI